MRTVCVNGDYVPEDKAHISIFDRGFLFADGVYEVTTVFDRKLVDFPGHLARLRRSLGELDMRFSQTDDEMLAMHRKLVEVNNLDNGLIYMQVTRGAADRDFLYPPADTPATWIAFTQVKELAGNPLAARGIRVAALPDLRWGRCDIKTVQLLYASMAKMEAARRGADDAWFVTDGQVTEGSSNNAYIVTGSGAIVTRDLSEAILSGITRRSVLACAEQTGHDVEERAFTLDEAFAASEAFMTSATSLVMPVVEIDGQKIGDGKPGPVATQLRRIYLDASRAAAI